MRMLLVQNAQAGSADVADPERVLRRHGHEVVAIDIERAAAIADASREPDLAGTERVVVAGGDGSIGAAAALAAQLDVPLGVVPAGTANDFARALELPSDPVVACELAAIGTQLRRIDLARLDGRPFVNVASFGIAPGAADAAASLKSKLGALAYPIGALLSLKRAQATRVHALVDGVPIWDGEAWQVMVASTGAFGGWADIGGTLVGDGQLDLVVVPAGRATRHLAFDAAALARGELAAREGVTHGRGAVVELRFVAAPQLVLDGEQLRADDRVVVARVDTHGVDLVVA
jgi:diacylglycerol kinase family enzyme